MTRMLKLGAAVIAAGLSLLPSLAVAQTPAVVIAVGSSALWQTGAIASWKLTGSAHHYTFKLTGPTTGTGAVGVIDNRDTTTIGAQQGNLSITWDNSTTPTKIFAGVSLDSTVGDRLVFGTTAANVPAGQLVLPSTIPSSANLIGVTWGSDDTTLPAAVVTALKNAPGVTTAFTDIRPEDAAFATARAFAIRGASVSDTAHSYAGLGYNGARVPTITSTGADINWVLSSFSSTGFQVVPFNAHPSGTDPISGGNVPTYTVYPVGYSPIVALVNRTNSSGLGAVNPSTGKFYITNLPSAAAVDLWTGSDCSTSVFGTGAPNVALTVNEREPLSGTYNTWEYQYINVPYTSVLANQTSQENSVDPTTSTGNPLNESCSLGGGVRRRAIGTGEMINTDIFGVADSIGYSFFTFGNVSKIAGSSSYGYLTLNGVDPLFSTYSTGQLPTTGTLSSLFSNVANGTYPVWSNLRVVTVSDTSSAAQTAGSSLAAEIISDISSGAQLPDFLPYNSSSTSLYRAHYSTPYTSGTICNGPAFTCGGTTGNPENGGDVNGKIETTGNVTNTRN